MFKNVKKTVKSSAKKLVKKAAKKVAAKVAKTVAPKSESAAPAPKAKGGYSVLDSLGRLNRRIMGSDGVFAKRGTGPHDVLKVTITGSQGRGFSAARISELLREGLVELAGTANEDGFAKVGLTRKGREALGA